ncbi:MAG: peptide-methionine (R)-S-oxide reductase MsrB [Bacteroidetes bacterium]|nr:MAG: peptide-methionine (R)-S-oxide reductase MsrB [Bacteroidota bacterium]
MKLLQFFTVITLLAGFAAYNSSVTNNTKDMRDMQSKLTDKQPDSTVKTIVKTEQEWKEQLTAEQYYILREKGTERAFTGKYLLNKETGVYNCAACGNPLFKSNQKFDSHCGWPSFDDQIEGAVKTERDSSHGMVRTEIMCARCGGHLGHVFDDGPTNTGLRYCVNSVSIDFERDTAVK